MSASPAVNDSYLLREVWNDNLEHEFGLIRDIVDNYPYIAMDTEFPGVVVKPLCSLQNQCEFDYHMIKVNVELLKLIQLGLTFSDENGTLPTCGTGKYCFWQINFREFNRDEDIYAHDSIELLRNSGIDLWKNRKKGVDARRFGELVMSSGIVMNDSVQVLTFDGTYDIAYLLKLLTGRSTLPDTLQGFSDLTRIYFPVMYDVKYMMRFTKPRLHGGLNALAKRLDIERFGISHQAGSDSLLTGRTFLKLKRDFFGGSPGGFAGALNRITETGRDTEGYMKQLMY